MAFELDDDNYKIIKPIGKGGMSTVYLARDKNLDRLVAIKLLHPTMSSDEKNRERLKIEALAIARINHENIVNVYNFVNKNDNSYIVMEYIDGFTLSDFIEKNPITNPELLLSLFLKILKGINFSHKKNIIHRDIKPENVMISKDGLIKIMDFGIASIVGEVHNLTTTGSIMGSPMFMSPEHLTDEKIDKQSDLFSLGIILYWMLTKTYPFSGKNTAQLLNNILKCQYQNPQMLSPLISNDIKSIISRILQKSKSMRYDSVELLIKDIESYLKNIKFNYESEIKIFFENKIGYHKHFMSIIPKKYLYYSKKLFQEKSYSKSISYAHLTLEYEAENAVAKDIIKKIERGTILKKYMPIALVSALVLGLLLYFFILNKEVILKRVNKKDISLKYTKENFKNIYKIINFDYKASYYSSEKLVKTGYDYLLKSLAESKKTSKLADKNAKTLTKSISLVHTMKSKSKIKKSNKFKKIKRVKKNKIKHKDINLKARISPKAASVYINNKLYGYGNINEIKLKSNTKYDIKVKSSGCHDYNKTIFYKDEKTEPLTIRLKWKSAKLKIINSQNGDIFIDNKYKGNNKEYNYQVKPDPLSNGKKSLNLKVIKNSKIIFKKDLIIKAGQVFVKKI